MVSNFQICWPNFSKQNERDKRCKKLGKSWREYTEEMANENCK